MTMKSTTYSLDERYDTFVGELVDSGRFNSAHEVMTDALRVYKEHINEQKLVALLDEAGQGTLHPFEPKAYKARMREMRSNTPS